MSGIWINPSRAKNTKYILPGDHNWFTDYYRVMNCFVSLYHKLNSERFCPSVPPWHLFSCSRHSLVDGDGDGAEEEPLANVVERHPQEEDQDEHQHHAPELPAPPLGQTKLRQELSADVAELLTTILGQATLAAEWGSARGRFRSVVIN